MPTLKSSEELFWEKVDKSSECWEWTGCRHKYGYGKLSANKKAYYAHRFSYEINVGPIPDGMFVCHACDNPPCVNPDHLFIGTHNDNVKDMIKKKRNTFGEHHPMAILSEEQVLGVLAALRFGFDGQSVARLFGVKKATISLIKLGKNWKHIPR